MLNLEVKDAVPDVSYALLAMETMGDRVRVQRNGRGLTQEQLGKLVGVSKSAVSQWEDGSTKNIKLATFLLLIEVLHTDANYLIWGNSKGPGPSRAAPANPARKGANKPPQT
jgi:transcriptional regulator with XRE-family HTH domain